jgi:acetylornithine deacetylase/succinyl-diaminopimelate desuccinylase-like protein
MTDSRLAFVTDRFETDIVSVLEEYIAIPAKSPHFEPTWAELGHLDRAVRLLESWAKSRPIAGLRTEIVRLPGRTPVLLLEIPASGVPASDDAVLLYGHFDKQPEMIGWEPDLGPWKPVRRGDRLYGRGGADDGYAIFASLTAIEAVQASGGKHARCVVLIEGCEESGSYDLPYYVEHLLPRIGTPSLVVCLDSGAGDYERLWMTTSLRGLVAGTLTARVLEEGVHSGDASGVVPSSFRVLRQLLDRIEDASTGRFLVPSFHVEVPALRRAQAARAAELLGDAVWNKFPWAGATRPMGTDPTELALARTWTPRLSVTGALGLPPIGSAGNVLRPETALKLSVRVPPGVDAKRASDELKALLERDPPSGATVRFDADQSADGWQAPLEPEWLQAALGEASRAHFGADASYMGEGGTIPFMAMLGARFPAAEFVITGVLGPHSNAHGPNEFLHLPMAARLSACVADVLVRHTTRAASAQ